MAIKMKKLLKEVDLEEYPADLDNYIVKKVKGKTIDGWRADVSSFPKEGVIYWHKGNYNILSSAGYEYPPIAFLFDVITDDGDELTHLGKQVPYKPTNLKNDYDLFMKYLVAYMKRIVED